MVNPRVVALVFLGLLGLLFAENDQNISVGDQNGTDLNLTEANKTWVDGKLMLWEVEGEHGGKVYLFGSIHVANAEFYPLDGNITQAFKDSNYLVLETKVDENAKIAVNTALFKKGRFEGEQTLKDVISEKNYENLQIKLRELKMLPGSLDPYHPWVASVIVTMTDVIRLGYSPQFGLDLYFAKSAQRQQKRIFSMESVNQQLGIFMDANDSLGEQMLELTLETGPQQRKDIETLFTNWKEGNTTFFEKELIAPMDRFPELKEAILTKRNEKMLQKVAIYRSNRKGRNYFVVMGLAHLIGPQGVVQGLKDQNLTVRRLGGHYETVEDTNGSFLLPEAVEEED